MKMTFAMFAVRFTATCLRAGGDSGALTKICGLLALCIWAGICTRARADGGQLLVSEAVGAWRVSVFASPSPLRRGPADVSVLVQSVENGGILSDATITIDAVTIDAVAIDAASVASKTTLHQRATAGAATNRLFQAARIEWPAAGDWQLTVKIARGSQVEQVQCTVAVAEAFPPWLDMTLWMAWPAVPVALYLTHQFLRHRYRRHTFRQQIITATVEFSAR